MGDAGDDSASAAEDVGGVSAGDGDERGYDYGMSPYASNVDADADSDGGAVDGGNGFAVERAAPAPASASDAPAASASASNAPAASASASNAPAASASDSADASASIVPASSASDAPAASTSARICQCWLSAALHIKGRALRARVPPTTPQLDIERLHRQQEAEGVSLDEATPSRQE